MTLTDGTEDVPASRSIQVSSEVLNWVSYRDSGEGILGVFRQRHRDIDSLPAATNSLILALEGLEKPGNLGAILRTCSAAGVTGLVLIDSLVDLFNPNVVRAAAGALFEVPVFNTSWFDFDKLCAASGIRILAASPHAKDVIWDQDLTGAVALVVGSEAHGLTPHAEETADALFRIPQVGTSVDSLNASVAAALAVYEALRQRL